VLAVSSPQYPWLRVRVPVGKGMGRGKFTQGLPLLITSGSQREGVQYGEICKTLGQLAGSKGMG